MLLIRIVEKLLILYFALYLLIDIWLYLSAFYLFLIKRNRKRGDKGTGLAAEAPVSILVPAYNEEVSLAMCVKMLMKLNYNNYQVIVINDGSTDATMEQMFNNFDFKPMEVDRQHFALETAGIRGIYTNGEGNLLLIDKDNGGKADAINAGINIAKGEYICTIDADSILDPDALHRVTAPMVRNRNIFVSGGQLALSNDLVLKENRVVSAKMPRNIWVHWQILEYISTFMVARLSLSKINALLIMSGAFSVFRKEDLLAVGGFLSKNNTHPYIIQNLGHGKHTITEDMEIVLRLWKYRRKRRNPAKAIFIPGPVCWTEAPEKPAQLYKQRKRWHQGLAETLWLYRDMLFEPRYRATGLIALPYYLFLELLAPVIKLFTIFFVLYLVISGELNQQWVILMLAGTILIATFIMSTITVIIEKWSMKQSVTNREALRYKGFGDWLVLLGSGVVGNFSYSFYRMFAQLNGLIDYFRKRQEWNRFERKGVKIAEENGNTTSDP